MYIAVVPGDPDSGQVFAQLYFTDSCQEDAGAVGT